MDCVGAGLLGGGDDLADIEIGLARGCAGPMRHGLIRHIDMQRVAVGVGIDRHGRDAKPLAPSRMMRQAISPRLAMRSLVNMVPDPRTHARLF